MRSIFNMDTKSPFAEIMFMIAVSFVPILIAAMFATANSQGDDNYFLNLLGFYQAGELGLYILSLNGTIGWLLIQTKLNLNGENYWLIGLLIFTIVMSAGTIGTNPKFEDSLDWFLHLFLVVAYILTIFGWYAAIKLKQSSESKFQQASRNLEHRDVARTELETIENIIGASDD